MTGRRSTPPRRCAAAGCVALLRPDRAYCAEHEPRQLVTMEGGQLIRPYKHVEHVDDSAPTFVTAARAREVREVVEADHGCLYQIGRPHPAASCRAIEARP